MIVSFSTSKSMRPSPGIICDNMVIDINKAYQRLLMDKGFNDDQARSKAYKVVPRNVLSLIYKGSIMISILNEIYDNKERFIGSEDITYKLSEVKLHAPIGNPGKLIGIGLNYKSHVEETGGRIPKEPIAFNKAVTSIIGPYDNILLPKISNQVDFEGELAIVISRKCKYVDRGEALNHVFGYMIANDVTARDLEFRDSSLLFFRSKSLDTFCPLGPGIVLREYIDDWRKLRIKTILNGVVMQDEYTSDMIFGIEELISFLSQDMTLMPGDIILTGTPSGVGFRRSPPIFLKSGDVVEVIIDGIGSIRNSVK
ncbi:MAG: fumarylacetoacetate hydrolase family protein [Candidatus Methanomethylicia archaeon]